MDLQSIYDMFARYGFGTGKVLVDLLLFVIFIGVFLHYIVWPVYDRFISPTINFWNNINSVHSKVEKIYKEVQTNGGGSLKDAVLSVSSQVKSMSLLVNKNIHIHRAILDLIGIGNDNSLGIYETDEKGNYLFITNRWCEITDMTNGESLGNGWVNSIHPDSRDKVTFEFSNAIRQERYFKMSYRLNNSPGTVVNYCFPLVVEGKIVGYIGAIKYYEENQHQRPADLS